MINRAIGTLGLFALICLLSFAMWYVNRPATSMSRELHSARSQLLANPGDGMTAEQRAADRKERAARMLERFPEADADKDGVLSQEELRAFRQNREQNNREAREGRQGREAGDNRARQRDQQDGKPGRPVPTHSDVAYGPHERNVIDLYLVESEKPTPLAIFIHGGGFTKGDKKQVSPRLITELHGAGISVAAINYQYASTEPLPGPMLDGARAVQFLRANAQQYNLDKEHFGVTGGSAGAGISLWIAMHDDLADPDSDDPVARESTRVSCAAVNGAQVSYDARFWINIGVGDGLKHDAFPTIFGYPVGTSWDDAGLVARAEASAPINFVSNDDPPMRFDYGVPNHVTEDMAVNQLVHHPLQGLTLQKACEPLGVICDVYYPPANRAPEPAWVFLIAYLQSE